MASLMRGDLLPIDPNRGAIVDRSEVQKEPLGIRPVKAAPVPKHIARHPLFDA